jgi:hypothetical protein
MTSSMGKDFPVDLDAGDVGNATCSVTAALTDSWLTSTMPRETRCLLSRYFDTIRHDRILAKVAGRVVDSDVLAMVKQFLKSTGDRGVPGLRLPGSRLLG